jgi:cytidylate kinase
MKSGSLRFYLGVHSGIMHHWTDGSATMPVVTISRGTFSGGRMLAEELARKLGCDCIESEVLGDAARKLGIPVARLKAAMVKAPSALRGFGREREMYLAAITAELCERALAGDLVYHGHAAHLLLPGVSNVVRVRVVADPEFRIQAAMTRLKLSWTQAKKYVRSVDLDRARWVDFLYGVDWTDPSHYDFVVNLERVAVPNAATALLALAELPDFKPTPASVQILNDLRLASRARVRLGTDPRTAQAEVVVAAHHGVLTIKHMPRQAHLVPLIPEVLQGLEDVAGLNCAIASTSILWIQERFTPSCDAFARVVEIARRWDAAVELMKLVPGAAAEPPPAAAAAPGRTAEEDGGVVFDADAAPAPPVDDEMAATLDALRHEGRAGQGRSLGADRLPAGLDPAQRYSLVVVGDVFGGKPEAVRGRQTRELRAALADHLGVPVVGLEELRQRLAFGPRHYLMLALGAVLIGLIYFLVLTHQPAVLRFFAGETFTARAVALTVLAVTVPLFAYLYGSCIGLVAKLLRFD